MLPAGSKTRTLAPFVLALCVACAGGGASKSSRAGAGVAKAPAPDAKTYTALEPRAPPLRSSHPATLLITEPSVLSELEDRGLSLTALFGGSTRATNEELARLPRFAPVLRRLRSDADEVKVRDPLAGVDVARFSHRLFDARFLESKLARFELAGVVNRPDRMAFDPSSCGEVRLVYRLAYRRDAERASKLPMTISVEQRVARPASGCVAYARRWLEPTLDPLARARWLRSEQGPLSPSVLELAPATFRVAANLQLVRWPSTIRPDLGGHAEYMLRSFVTDADRGALRAELLENTVDPVRLRSRPALARALETWLNDDANWAAIDAGTALLPRALLSERAISVTPRGLGRLANRPFTSALEGSALSLGATEQSRFVKSEEGLKRRLDQMSCPGCHQARSVAGFHLLGEDPLEAAPENALAYAVSPHVLAELPRRARVLETMLADGLPDLSAPFPERAAASDGGYGAHCALRDDPTFAAWSCESGLNCSAFEAARDETIGQCLPPEPAPGDPCESAVLLAHRDPRRDRLGQVELRDCPGAVCNRSAVGFPGGMCTASCRDDRAVCGKIAILDAFNACLARGESFLSCTRNNVSSAGLKACSAARPCRDDYVCARGGVCIPPYFLFQLRVDGHYMPRFRSPDPAQKNLTHLSRKPAL
jgi:hypothetical protein